MKPDSKIAEYIQALKGSKRLGNQVVYHHVIPPFEARWASPQKPWPQAIERILKRSGIAKLYDHQAQAVDLIRAGGHVVVATPTASGKTLIYNLPVIEQVLADENAKALYLFPLKALAQDQRRAFAGMVEDCSERDISAAIYDGDTSSWHRRKIRERPPHVLMTNPEMMHLSLLPHHPKWVEFLSGLRIVVVDEVHTYRGVMGSHMAQIFRRFQRICAMYGSAPLFLFSSATVANPAQLAAGLTGLEVQTVDRSGAPQGQRHVVFMEALEGPAQTAMLLLKAALHRGLRTIVYTQSRKMAELMAIWAGNQTEEFADRISAYRAGFLPEERREIEARLTTGDLLAVISTSALELGIDIGDLDLCILVGYPGSVVATWQRGGRVGRSGQEAALVLIPGEDALDQYFLRNPRDLLEREPEAAVINPYNPTILQQHLVCAAAELALKENEPLLVHPEAQQAVRQLVQGGDLLLSGDGTEYYARLKAPHRHVNLRGSGDRFTIVDSQSGESRGEIDGFRAFRETHPGAVYLHRGEIYLVEDLDIPGHTATVVNADVNYYTRVQAEKDTQILEQSQTKAVGATTVFLGRLEVTDQVTGYEKWQIHAKRRLNKIPLDLPPVMFETEGLWFKIPLEIQRATEAKYLHFMGGIHAIEHAAIGILPLLVMTDRNDLGGISIPFHPQVGSAAVFIYDGAPGGAGLSRQAYERAMPLLDYTLKIIATCGCEAGCPSCVHSPKCGSGNRPIDKTAALFILEQLTSRSARARSAAARAYRPGGTTLFTSSQPQPPAAVPIPQARATTAMPSQPVESQKEGVPSPVPDTARPVAVQSAEPHIGVFDLETQLSAKEVGGWGNSDRMLVSCGVLYDSRKDQFIEYLEDEIPKLIEHLQQVELVVGFNHKRFDYRVLSHYSDYPFKTLPSLDLLEKVYERLGYRLSLDHLAKATLGVKKSADGLQALRWWKQGRIREIVEYCTKDVRITRDLYRYGRENRYLLFTNKAGNTVRVPVSW